MVTLNFFRSYREDTFIGVYLKNISSQFAHDESWSGQFETLSQQGQVMRFNRSRFTDLKICFYLFMRLVES